MSSVVAALAAVGAMLLLTRVGDVGISTVTEVVVTTFVFIYPVYAVVYVGWSTWAYSRLDAARLHDVAAAEHRAEQRPLYRTLGMTGTVNTTLTAAVVAVVVTIGIAQSPAFRSQQLYLLLGLLTVASAWALMVFAFAQAYVRLVARAGRGDGAGAPIRFPFDDRPRFGDYLTLTLLMSTMAATVSAEISTRPAWRLVRANVLVAFVFNTVIIAMTVSLLFGSIAA